jgi:hypothetical protein
MEWLRDYEKIKAVPTESAYDSKKSRDRGNFYPCSFYLLIKC